MNDNVVDFTNYNTSLMCEKANELYNHGKYVEAIAIYTKLLILFGDDVVLLYNLANAHYMHKNYAIAICYYSKCITSYNYAPAYHNYGMLLVDICEYDLAYSYLSQFIKLSIANGTGDDDFTKCAKSWIVNYQCTRNVN